MTGMVWRSCAFGGGASRGPVGASEAAIESMMAASSCCISWPVANSELGDVLLLLLLLLPLPHPYERKRVGIGRWIGW